MRRFIEMVEPDSIGYPFLAVAQEFNVPYRDVLYISDALEHGFHTFPPGYLKQDWVVATIAAHHREMYRRGREKPS